MFHSVHRQGLPSLHTDNTRIRFLWKLKNAFLGCVIMNFILLYKLVNQVLVSAGKWKTGFKKNKQDPANLCEAHFFFLSEGD